MCSSYLSTGSYKDGGSLFYERNSVELYLPWNDTWIDLPTLPEIIYANVLVLNMTSTRIMSMALAGNLNALYLVGGSGVDWNMSDEIVNKSVWQLKYSNVNYSYYWANDTEMGKCGMCCKICHNLK